VTRAPEQNAAVIEACRKKSRRWRTHDRGEVHPREDDGAVGCNPEVPLLALAFRKDDMLAGEPAGRQPQEQ
jgi:hypothetical protein